MVGKQIEGRLAAADDEFKYPHFRRTKPGVPEGSSSSISTTVWRSCGRTLKS